MSFDYYSNGRVMTGYNNDGDNKVTKNEKKPEI